MPFVSDLSELELIVPTVPWPVAGGLRTHLQCSWSGGMVDSWLSLALMSHLGSASSVSGATGLYGILPTAVLRARHLTVLPIWARHFQ